MRKQTHKFLAALLAVAMLLLVIPLPTFTVRAASYDANAAISYAAAHWNDGNGKCATFVSNCLSAGGCTAWSSGVGTLQTALIDGGWGVKYKLTTRNNYIYVSDNIGKISVGDPIFYYCTVCKGWEHTIICTGVNSGNQILCCAHNPSWNNKDKIIARKEYLQDYGYYDENHHYGDTLEVYSIHMVANSVSTSFDDYYELTAPDGFQSLRSSASSSSSELARIPTGTVVNVTNYNSDRTWGYLSYNGQSGWIRLYYVTKTTKPHTHSYGTWQTVNAATCNSAGSRKRVCSCGDTQTETIPATGHNPSDWITDREAQIGVAGSKHKECTVCHTVLETETIPALENPVTHIDETKPYISVDTKNARPGGTADINIILKNNPGIASLKLKVGFDSDLTLTNIAYKNNIGGNSQQPQTLESPVVLNWYNGATNTKEDFVFATLTFKVEDNATFGAKDITLTYNPEDIYNIAENNVSFAVKNGGVNIISYIPGDINNDGNVNNKDLTRLFQYLSEWDVAVNEAALDINGDGNINNKDLTRLFQYLSEWNVEIF